MTVIRRLDAVLEDTKDEVLRMKEKLDKSGNINQTEALCRTAKQSFCNMSKFRLKDLTSRASQQKLKIYFLAYLEGFSPNVQEILKKFKFHVQTDTMADANILGAVIEKFVSPSILYRLLSALTIPIPYITEQAEPAVCSPFRNHLAMYQV
ncbi:MAG: type I restriction-modification system subunit M N-terminal domain-containing protein [Holophagales bacterium]|jgi:type I restriction enzyme M protein|nr:type I restriction-modification system subunit M N-terminal domain-containing protein [Holophagales bacterium]